MGVSVAIPTLDGAATLPAVLSALPDGVEVVVLDSSSSDGSRKIAARAGATVHVIPRAEFGHGRSRNRLMELTSGDRVAFLTQDAVPVGGWLDALTAPDAALTYGPYRAPAGAPAMLRREYADVFGGDAPSVSGWVSSANLCLSRAAWARTPFRDVAYAEDQQLLRDLRAAGEHAVYVPAAAVVHGHDYTTAERFRRAFDEWRGLHAVHGWTAPAAPRALAGTVRAEVRRDRAYGAGTAESITWHTARVLGAALGSRADGLPPALRRALSLESRA